MAVQVQGDGLALGDRQLVIADDHHIHQGPAALRCPRVGFIGGKGFHCLREWIRVGIGVLRLAAPVGRVVPIQREGAAVGQRVDEHLKPLPLRPPDVGLALVAGHDRVALLSGEVGLGILPRIVGGEAVDERALQVLPGHADHGPRSQPAGLGDVLFLLQEDILGHAPLGHVVLNQDLALQAQTIGLVDDVDAAAVFKGVVAGDDAAV